MTQPVFAVVGHPNKGKSSIVSTLACDDSVHISPEPGTTMRCRRYPMRLDGDELYALVDTPGFQRARRALQWMRKHETTADHHPDVVRQFVEEHRQTRAFPDECELLTPIMEGAGILYVVDGSVPYGPEYEPEMEILRWTGRPSMALINPIGQADYIEQWRNALGQYFKVVRVFDALMAAFDKRLELLRAFGQLREDWRQPLEKAIGAMEDDRRRRRHLAARAIASAVADMLTLKVEKKLPDEADVAALKPKLEQQYRDELRGREQRCRDEVEEIYEHHKLARQEGALVDVGDDLFAERTWRAFGLSRTKLMTAGAVSGATAGAVVDAHLGATTFFTGALIGGALGAATGWWAADQLVKVKIMHQPLGGRMLVAGPTRNANFPYVLLGRARYHHRLIARRTHAQRGDVDLQSVADEQPLSEADRRDLAGHFRQLRKGRDADKANAALAACVERMLEQDDGPTRS